MSVKTWAFFRTKKGKTEGLAQTELLVKAAHAATGVHQLLLTGEKGVTVGAALHLDVLIGRAGLDHVAAGTTDGSLRIVGMDAFLHWGFTSFMIWKSLFRRIGYSSTF